MSYQIESEIKRIAMETVRYSPYVTELQLQVQKLQTRLDEMERRCVCVKINAPCVKKEQV